MSPVQTLKPQPATAELCSDTVASQVGGKQMPQLPNHQLFLEMPKLHSAVAGAALGEFGQRSRDTSTRRLSAKAPGAHLIYARRDIMLAVTLVASRV